MGSKVTLHPVSNSCQVPGEMLNPYTSPYHTGLQIFIQSKHLKEEQQHKHLRVLCNCLKGPDPNKHSEVFSSSIFLLFQVFISRNLHCPNKLQLIPDEILVQCHRKPFVDPTCKFTFPAWASSTKLQKWIARHNHHLQRNNKYCRSNLAQNTCTKEFCCL